MEASHFEPETDEYLAVLVAEDRKRIVRRRITGWVAIGLAVLIVAAALLLGYRYTQTQYYIAEQDGRVALFQGVQQDLGPIRLSHLLTVTPIQLADLPRYRQDAVRATISAGSLERADEILQELQNAAR